MESLTFIIFMVSEKIAMLNFLCYASLPAGRPKSDHYSNSVHSFDRLGHRGGGRKGGGGGGMGDDSAEIVFQSFSTGGPCQQFWHGPLQELTTW